MEKRIAEVVILLNNIIEMVLDVFYVRVFLQLHFGMALTA